MSATKTPPPPRRATTKRAKSKKAETLQVTISADSLAIFTTFADHFGLTPEMVMEAGIIGQLAALGDDTVASVAWHLKRPAVHATETVTLAFIPEAKELLVLVASLLNRPLDWLLNLLLSDESDTLGGEMDAAVKEGGFDNNPELEEMAKRVLASEFDARRGRMPRESRNLDAWEWLALERFRPSRFTKGGSSK